MNINLAADSALSASINEINKQSHAFHLYRVTPNTASQVITMILI